MRRHSGGRNGFAIRARDGCIAENTRKCIGRKREEGLPAEPLSVARSGSFAVRASGRNGRRIVGSAAGAVRRSRGREISGGACRFHYTIPRSRCHCRTGGSSSSGRAAGRSAMGRAEADSAAGCVSIRDGFGAAGGFRRAEADGSRGGSRLRHGRNRHADGGALPRFAGRRGGNPAGNRRHGPAQRGAEPYGGADLRP